MHCYMGIGIPFLVRYSQSGKMIRITIRHENGPMLSNRFESLMIGLLAGAMISAMQNRFLLDGMLWTIAAVYTG